MELIFSEKAERDLESMDNAVRALFRKHAEKIMQNPAKRHLRFGLPFWTEEVTHQARLVYKLDSNACYILRCFATHKEYERWYKSYK